MANTWYKSTTAGNWNATTSWDVHAGGDGTDGAVPSAGDIVIFDANSAACAVNVNTNALESLTMTNYANALSGTSTIIIGGLTASTKNCILKGLGTWTGTLNFAPVSITAVINFTSSGELLSNITITSGAAVSLVVLQDNLTFTAVKTCSITLTERGLDVNGKTITGNSAVNKLLITSNTLGTSTNRTITGASATTFNNVDFRDISFATAGALDLTNSQVNWIGDCGGNSATGGALTFTTADDWWWHSDTAGAGTYNFSDYTYWYTATNGGGSQMGSTRCPLPQDNCNFDADSVFYDGGAVDTTVDQDMPRMCKTLDFTGVDAMAFHMNNVNQTLYGGLTFVSNVSLTYGSTIIFESMDRSGTYNFTPKSASTIQSGVTIQSVGGSVVLQTNDLTLTGNLILNNGTFDANDLNVITALFNSNNSNARTLLMGNGTWTINSTSANTSWNMGTTSPPTGLSNPTTMAEGSTIVWGSNNNNAMVFAGAGCTYNNLTVIATGTSHTLTGSNTFNTFTINAPKTVKFTAGTTQTVNNFIGSRVTISSNTSQKPAYLIGRIGYYQLFQISIKDLIVSGQAIWMVIQGNDGGGNRGFKFSPLTLLSELQWRFFQGGATAWTKSFSEAITLTNTLTKFSYKVLSETLTTANTVVKKPQKVVSDSIIVTDTLVKLFHKVNTESLTVTNTLVKKFFKVLSESSTITDTITKKAFKSISDSILITEEATLPGVSHFIKTRYIAVTSGLKDYELQQIKQQISKLSYKDIETLKNEFTGKINKEDLVRMNSDLKELLKDWK